MGARREIARQQPAAPRGFGNKPFQPGSHRLTMTAWSDVLHSFGSHVLPRRGSTWRPRIASLSGLVVLYDFEEGAGTTIRDRSQAAPPLDLRIETPRVVRWKPGAIAIDGSAAIASAAPATKIVEAVTKSGEISIEAWVKPANTTQNGPARIVSLSADPGPSQFHAGAGWLAL